ncbi:MAG: 50S ribosome-binding GTPase [Planctomycetia bacterium]|nr:50S ribosome-binding GTPase [Planctomycetia bacterium]
MDDAFFPATPEGRGAIAVVVVLSPRWREVVARFFSPKSGRLLDSYADGALVYGMIGLEDVLVCPINDAQGEIQCHGSVAAVRRIEDFLEHSGFRRLSRAEFLQRTMPKLSPNQARAYELLPEAATLPIAEILWDQAQGAYERALDRGDDVRRWDAFAQKLVEPWRVLLCGAPNVGKSSLFNAILGYSRAIVFEEAGTTRDVLRERTVLNGLLFEFIDVAGLRSAASPVEKQGVLLAEEEIRRADLVLRIRSAAGDCDESACDSSDFWDDPLWASCPSLCVWNKCDVCAPPPGAEGIFVSAKSGAGLAQLLEAVERALVPELPPPGTGMRLVVSYREN